MSAKTRWWTLELAVKLGSVIVFGAYLFFVIRGYPEFHALIGGINWSFAFWLLYFVKKWTPARFDYLFRSTAGILTLLEVGFAFRAHSLPLFLAGFAFGLLFIYSYQAFFASPPMVRHEALRSSRGVGPDDE